MKTDKEYFDTIICGGGPAGMMAGIHASKSKVLLLEKNKQLGVKLRITGNGRCNITNASDPRDHLDRLRSNAYFYYPAIYGEPSFSTMDFLEREGLPLKIEAQAQVFPKSDRSKDVVDILEKALIEKKVQIHLGEEIISIQQKADFFQVRTNKNQYRAKKIIIATGGLSYPKTGSTGDGYTWARSFGHQITKLYPSLSSVLVSEKQVGIWEGISLADIQISLWEKRPQKKKIYEQQGDILFTKTGITGPLAFLIAAVVTDKIEKKPHISIDLMPNMTSENLEMQILTLISSHQNQRAKNGLRGLMPKGMLPGILAISGIDPEKSLQGVTREERRRLLHTIKFLELQVTGVGGFKEAVITKGGVLLDEIEPSTLESKLVKNLFFAGEILDLDSVTGGFNLQIAFSTGKLAGISSEDR